MGSGKSLHLLATANNFQEHLIPFIIIKSSIDTRDGKDTVYSRALGNRECVSVSESENLFDMITKYLATEMYYDGSGLKWILVDEAQFLTEKQVDELAEISDKYGINILCYGLRTDFKTQLFPGSKRLFEIADSFEEIKSSCYCGKKVIFNARMNSNKEIVTDGEQVDIGGDDKYVSLCRKCYYKKTGKYKGDLCDHCGNDENN